MRKLFSRLFVILACALLTVNIAQAQFAPAVVDTFDFSGVVIQGDNVPLSFGLIITMEELQSIEIKPKGLFGSSEFVDAMRFHNLAVLWNGATTPSSGEDLPDSIVITDGLPIQAGSYLTFGWQALASDCPSLVNIFDGDQIWAEVDVIFTRMDGSTYVESLSSGNFEFKNPVGPGSYLAVNELKIDDNGNIAYDATIFKGEFERMIQNLYFDVLDTEGNRVARAYQPIDVLVDGAVTISAIDTIDSTPNVAGWFPGSPDIPFEQPDFVNDELELVVSVRAGCSVISQSFYFNQAPPLYTEATVQPPNFKGEEDEVEAEGETGESGLKPHVEYVFKSKTFDKIVVQNPASMINILAGGDQINLIVVTDMMGRQIGTFPFTGTPINTGVTTAGIYTLQFLDEDGARIEAQQLMLQP